MKRLIFKGLIILLIIIISANISFANSTDPLSWDYENNNNIPGRIDKNGNEIPNIIINDNFIMVDVYGHWAQDAITYCAKKGILDNTLSRKFFFSPDSWVDKSDLVTFLGREKGIDYFKYRENYFSDCKVLDSFESDTDIYISDISPFYVNWAGEEGILKGNGENLLKDNTVTREEVATIIDRYIEKETDLYNNKNSKKTMAFKDVDQISSWASLSVEKLSNLELMNGDEYGYFQPKKEISRAEICQILMNLSEKESRK